MRLLTKPVLHGGDCGNCTQQALLVGLSYLEHQSCLAGNEQKGKNAREVTGNSPSLPCIDSLGVYIPSWE